MQSKPAIRDRAPSSSRLLSLGPELIAHLQLEFSPSQLMPLLKTCKGMRKALDSNKDYWAHVAVHLIWQHAMRFHPSATECSLMFPEDSYRPLVGRMVAVFRRGIRSMASETESDGTRKKNSDAEKEVAFWGQYVDAPLETQVRMRMLYEYGEDFHCFRFISVTDCLILPMKEVAHQVAEHMVRFHANNESDDTPAVIEYRTEKTRALHRWVRAFASMPDLAKKTKIQLMRELSGCLEGRFLGGKYVGLDMAQVRLALHWFREEEEGV